MLYFCTGDYPTDHNLNRLNHLASLDRFDGNAEQMHQWLGAVIQSIEALPQVAAYHFTGYYLLGKAHFDMREEERTAKWKALAMELRDHINAAHADPVLRSDNSQGAPDISDRRQSRGERLIGLCDKLERALWGTPRFDEILAQISNDGVDGIRSDVTQLEKLSARKRISDLREHQYRIARHIMHIRLIAEQVHHLP